MNLYIEHSQSVNNYNVQLQLPTIEHDPGLPMTALIYCFKEGVSPVYGRQLFKRKVRMYCTVEAVYVSPRGIHLYITPHSYAQLFRDFALRFGQSPAPTGVTGYELWLPKSTFRKFRVQDCVGKRCILQCMPTVLCYKGYTSFYITAYYISQAK